MPLLKVHLLSNAPHTYMPQPQIGLHDLIDFILKTEQNW